jgi:uncharacterized protein YceH (UPF0502 family)
MTVNLAFETLRVLGSLMEKEMVTPDLYPLSLNALVNAANQRSSREPVTDLTEDQVRAALDVLEANQLVATARDGGRVVKFEHRIRTVLNLRRDETAVLCLLLLRGPQTPGELRSRSDRMYQFEDLAQLQSTLDRLSGREQPLVAVLPRVPGSREARWIHLLGDPADRADRAAAQSLLTPDANSEVEALRSAVSSLESRVAVLEQRLQAIERPSGPA